jgi:hypothetical protein
VLVSRGDNAPGVFAYYTAMLGSPVGTTTGTFRFSCSAAQAPCKVSIAAAVLSDETGMETFYPRVLIYKENGPGAPETFCEYADGANNNLGLDTISRVPMDTHIPEIKTPLDMGIGGTLDCDAGQPYTPTVDDICVPHASSGGTAYNDVETTFIFH